MPALPTPEDPGDPTGFLAAAAAEGFDPMNVVIVDDHAWAVREADDGTLTLTSFSRVDERITPAGVASQQGQPGAVETSAMMSASNGFDWTVFAGRVPDGVAWVRALGEPAEGGWVHERLFLIAYPGRLLYCDDIRWQMLDPAAGVVREGRGLFGEPGC